jgi:IS30 family transposase
LVIRPALVAVSRGATLDEAAALVGVHKNTLCLRVRDEGVVVFRDRRQREGALTQAEREEIFLGVERDESDAEIAVRLGRHRATVWREIRNNGGRKKYRPFAAQARADEQARRPKQRWFELRLHVFAEVVRLMRDCRFSPELVSYTLRQEHPGEPEWWVSHEAIYQAIYVQAKPELRRELASYLRRNHERRKSRARTMPTGSRIVGMVNISERPPEAADRAVPGHWEGDLIVGANGSAIATLIERSTRWGMLVKLENRTTEHVVQRIAEKVAQLPDALKRSLTWDQGNEMAHHIPFTVITEVPVYFADPRSPWQRGSNENWNGIVRWILPKGSDLSVHSQDELDHVAAIINGRPRKLLEWKTPTRAFNELVAPTA